MQQFLEHYFVDGKKQWRFVCTADSALEQSSMESQPRPPETNQPSSDPVAPSQPLISVDVLSSSAPNLSSSDSSRGETPALANLPESLSTRTLPMFTPANEVSFTWGSVNCQDFCHSLEATYQEIVHWRSNCFTIPNGNVGKRFVLELARLFRAAGEGSSLESIALKAV